MPNFRFFIFSVFLISSLTALSQVQTFGGEIVDQRTNRAVEEMELTVEHLATHKKYVTETNDDGKFMFKNLPVGKYKLAVTDIDY